VATKANVGRTAEALMTPEEAAEYLNVTRRWIERKVSERAIPYTKLGREDGPARLRFRRAALDAWLDEHSIEPGV